MRANTETAMPEILNSTAFNGHSMVAPLRRVLICSPETAGWKHADRWQELGFHHQPGFSVAQSQHQALCRELETCGAGVVELPSSPDLTLDAVYTHDASLATDYGLIVMRAGKPNRVAEGPRHGSFCESLGMPILGAIAPPGSTEAGDILWLDRETVLVGRGYRTNTSGIEQIRVLLAPHRVNVMAAPLP